MLGGTLLVPQVVGEKRAEQVVALLQPLDGRSLRAAVRPCGAIQVGTGNPPHNLQALRDRIRARNRLHALLHQPFPVVLDVVRAQQVGEFVLGQLRNRRRYFAAVHHPIPQHIDGAHAEGGHLVRGAFGQVEHQNHRGLLQLLRRDSVHLLEDEGQVPVMERVRNLSEELVDREALLFVQGQRGFPQHAHVVQFQQLFAQHEVQDVGSPLDDRDAQRPVEDVLPPVLRNQPLPDVSGVQPC